MRQQVFIITHTCDLCGKQVTIHVIDPDQQPAGWKRNWVLQDHTHAVNRNGKLIRGGRNFDYCEDHKIEQGKVVEHLGKSTEEYTLYQQPNGYVVQLNSYGAEAKN